MSSYKSNRIETIDLLRGLVMIIMVLDHVRYYIHLGSTNFNPTNLSTTTPLLFFTRFITHYCAPAFIFLAGIAACLYGSNKTKPELFRYLLSRGIWLVILEIFVNDFVWFFDKDFEFIQLQVIWVIGVSMILLSFMTFCPRKVILITGIVLIAGHNMLDNINVEGNSLKSILWYILHQIGTFPIGEHRTVGISYPLIPWPGVMMLGYYLGNFYKRDIPASLRKKRLLLIGMSVTILFFILRSINGYGDPVPWSNQKNFIFTALSFFNVTKYPASFLFLLITLGPSILFLSVTENIKNKITDFIIVFGRVPLFFYFLHIFVIHLAAVIVGGNWIDFLRNGQTFKSVHLGTFELSLWIVYAAWICLIFLLYPLCKIYMKFKINHKEIWWLSYL